MSRFRLLFSEALHSIQSNLSTTVAATMTVFIGMFLLGICIALGSWMVSWSNHTKSQITVGVYLCAPDTCARAAKPNEIEAVRQRISTLQGQGLVKKYEFVSKEQALAEQKKKHPDLYEALLTNPLPDAYQVTPARAEDVSKIAAAIRTPPLAGVQTVTYHKKTTERVLRVAKVIEISFVLMVVILLAASTALIANTIRLSIFSRRREIEVMKLVGATNWFVRGPFLIEGMLCSLGGAIFAVILLVLAKAIAMSAIHIDASSDVHAWPFALTAFLMLLAGLALGAAGTTVTLRRFLQV
jgi:cell division transport system permease protein